MRVDVGAYPGPATGSSLSAQVDSALNRIFCLKPRSIYCVLTVGDIITIVVYPQKIRSGQPSAKAEASPSALLASLPSPGSLFTPAERSLSGNSRLEKQGSGIGPLALCDSLPPPCKLSLSNCILLIIAVFSLIGAPQKRALSLPLFFYWFLAASFPLSSPSRTICPSLRSEVRLKEDFDWLPTSSATRITFFWDLPERRHFARIFLRICCHQWASESYASTQSSFSTPSMVFITCIGEHPSVSSGGVLPSSPRASTGGVSSGRTPDVRGHRPLRKIDNSFDFVVQRCR